MLIYIYHRIEYDKNQDHCPTVTMQPRGTASLFFREVKTGKSKFLGSQLSRDVNFPKESKYPGKQLFREVNFSGDLKCFEPVQTGSSSNRFKPVPVQTGSDRFTPVQTSSNQFKLVQTGSGSVQTVSIQF